MNKLSNLAISLVAVVGMGGLAVAGDAKDPRAGAPKADAAKTDAPKADAAKTDAPKADAAKMAMPMEMPKAPAELADLAKMATGTWKCKGQGMGHDMKMADMTATMKMKLDLNGWWMHGSFDSKMGKEPFQFESFTTYDAAAKKFHRVMVESGGSWASGDATMAGMKVDWELQSHGLMGESAFRDHEDMTDMKTGTKMWGEASMDKGKTWMKVYEMTCKK